MEQTESTIVQVAPNYENHKIAEMQNFGWNLQNRQEIHETGNSQTIIEGSNFVTKTAVSHYVKLHFARSLSLPGLQGLRRLESEYRSLPFPQSASLSGPGCLVALFAFFFLGAIGTRELVPVALISLLVVAGGIWWFTSRLRQRSEAEKTCQESAEQSEEILNQARSLLS